ncbi:hypothetical protein FGIG_10919 [Fasciola gigantica]|uniref:Uncharacterized protein n=1 Tax=Fasciola gigantica TaxID=46835 RepID=A0A504YSF1_FASGI|nr:hypothetical protein FGIG_10919 [Fasciola gigantica]
MQWPDSCEKDSLSTRSPLLYMPFPVYEVAEVQALAVWKYHQFCLEGRKTRNLGAAPGGIVGYDSNRSETGVETTQCFSVSRFPPLDTLKLCRRTAARPSDSIRRPSHPSRNLFGVRDYQRHSVPKAVSFAIRADAELFQMDYNSRFRSKSDISKTSI